MSTESGMNAAVAPNNGTATLPKTTLQSKAVRHATYGLRITLHPPASNWLTASSVSSLPIPQCRPKASE